MAASIRKDENTEWSRKILALHSGEVDSVSSDPWIKELTEQSFRYLSLFTNKVAG